MSQEIKPIRTVGKRGKDKQPRKYRNDTIQTAVSDDVRSKIICHDMMVRRLGKLHNPNDITEVEQRIETYLTLCMNNSVSPTVAGLALSLGIDRRTLWQWIEGVNGTIKSPEVKDTLKSVYSSIAAMYEEMLTEGKIIPVSAFFLMKNNHGYKDQTDHIVTARQEQPETEETLLNRANLLTDGE